MTKRMEEQRQAKSKSTPSRRKHRQTGDPQRRQWFPEKRTEIETKFETKPETPQPKHKLKPMRKRTHHTSHTPNIRTRAPLGAEYDLGTAVLPRLDVVREVVFDPGCCSWSVFKENNGRARVRQRG